MESNANNQLSDSNMAQEAELPKLPSVTFIDDKISTRKIAAALPTIILDSTTARHLHPDCSVNISIKSDSWMNMIKIFLFKYVGDEGQRSIIQTILYVNHKSFIERSEINAYSRTDFVKMFPEIEIAEDMQAWEVTLTLDVDYLANEHGFVGCHDFAQPVIQSLQKTGKLRLIIIGVNSFPQQFDDACKGFQEDTDQNRLLRFAKFSINGRPIFQIGQHTTVADRPDPSEFKYNVRYSFRDFDDWSVVTGYGHIIEQEHIGGEISAYEKHTHTMRITEQPGCGKGEYLAILPVPADEETRLSPGDKMQIFFGEDQDPSEAWPARVTQPFPSTPASVFTIYLYRPWDKVKSEFREIDTKLPIISLEDLKNKNPNEPYRTILEHDGIEVTIKISASEKVYRRSMKALDDLSFNDPGVLVGRLTSDLRNMLPATRLDKIPKHDVFADCRSVFPQVESVMDINDEQSVAVKAAGMACGGLSLVHGPPGTGKTHFLRQCAKPAMMMPTNVQVLVLSPTNAGTNSLTRALHEQLLLLQKQGTAPPWKYVVRVHSAHTTTDIWTQPAKLARGPPANARPKAGVLGDNDRAFLEELDLARHFHEARESDNYTRHELITDKRVDDIKLSLGYRCLQICGLARGGPNLPDDLQRQADAGFVSLYKIWRAAKKEEDFIKEQMEQMMNEAKFIKDCVLKNAACVITTCSNATITDITASCSETLSMIFIDEFARESEGMFVSIAAAPFTNLKGIIGVGDPYQLNHLVMSSEKTNPFASQLKLSLQARLTGAGFESTLLRKQWRMLPEIAAGPNEIVYDGLLRNAPSTARDQRPIARKLIKFNAKKHRKSEPIICLDVVSDEANTAAITLTANGQSRYNEFILKTIIDKAVEVLEAFPEAKIAYCTAYQAQMRLALSAYDRMVANGVKNVENLTITTWDGAQGLEWDIGLIDILITTSAGFQAEMSRLNVIFTRFRHGFYVVSCMQAIWQLKHVRWLHEFQKSVKKYRVPVKCGTTLTGNKHFTPGQVNMKTSDEVNAADSDDGWGKTDNAETGNEMPIDEASWADGAENAGAASENAGDVMDWNWTIHKDL